MRLSSRAPAMRLISTNGPVLRLRCNAPVMLCKNALAMLLSSKAPAMHLITNAPVMHLRCNATVMLYYKPPNSIWLAKRLFSNAPVMSLYLRGNHIRRSMIRLSSSHKWQQKWKMHPNARKWWRSMIKWVKMMSLQPHGWARMNSYGRRSSPNWTDADLHPLPSGKVVTNTRPSPGWQISLRIPVDF